MRAILITGTTDPIVAPGAWDDAAGCATAGKEGPFGRTGQPAVSGSAISDATMFRNSSRSGSARCAS